MIAVSDAVKASMPASLDVEVLIHGIDVEGVAAQKVHRSAVRKELGIADDEIAIGVVANFRKEKAYDVLLDAAAVVVAEKPEVRFVSVGQGPLEAQIRAQHERLGLWERFLILGYREDATRVMSAFDIFTSSSHHEGLPVSLMEAIALELPVVATAVGGIPDALKGSGALLVKAGDVDALAEQLQRSVQSRRAPMYAGLQFGVGTSARRLESMYRSRG